MFYLKGKKMRWLYWGKQHKVSGATALKKEVRGHEAVIAECTNDPLFIYNTYIRIHTLEHPVDQLNERQLKAVQEFKARQESAIEQTSATPVSV